jgi:type VI secretion system protein ImpA
MTDASLDAFALPPISDLEPCGPDLDLADDKPFMDFLVQNEGRLPSKFYDFQDEPTDFAEPRQTAETLLRRTHDLRLLVLLAKFSILDRDIVGFARWVGTTAWLLNSHWEQANPRAEDGDFGLRLGQLSSLEDNHCVLLPLQFAPVLDGGRFGTLWYRAHQIAIKAATPRVEPRFSKKTGEKEGVREEKHLPARTVEQLLREIDLDKIIEAQQLLSGLAFSIETIKKVTIENVGHELAIQLPNLAEVVGNIAAFLQAALVKRDPSRAPPPASADEFDGASSEGGAAAVRGASNFGSLADIDAALGAAFGYFVASEPSSPAVLLIRQARETLGKNLYEIMKLLTPGHADNARLFVGPDSAFTVPVKSLANAGGAEVARAQTPAAASREIALGLIDAVANHMRRVEPSSPTPYLLERARNLASRDFLSLLQDVLPEEALAAMKKGK